jgi:hypothetical protein
LEFRRHHRKKVRLNGEYFVIGSHERGEIIIEDVSAGGIRFETLKPHYISRDYMVILIFKLDNTMKTEIQKVVKVKWIINRTVGSQYVDQKPLEPELESYLHT